MVLSLIHLLLNVHEDRGGYLAKGSGKWSYVYEFANDELNIIGSSTEIIKICRN